MIELYHAEPAANSLKSMIAVHEKKIDFVSRYVNLQLFEQYEAAFLAINPKGQVPALVHDGRLITESTVINEYLEDIFPAPPLRPGNPWERAQMRIWTKLVDEALAPAATVLAAHQVSAHVTLSPEVKEWLFARIPLGEMRDKWMRVAGDGWSETEQAAARQQLKACISRLEETLAQVPWLAGTSYSLADVNTFPMAIGLPDLVPELVSDRLTPRLAGWLERMKERPGVRAALAMPDKYEETMQKLARGEIPPPGPKTTGG